MDRHFQSDQIKVNLKSLSVRGGVFSLAGQVPTLILHVISVIVLARLLAPEDFGLVAMATAITGLIAMFETMGLSTAVVQEREINHAQVSSLFWINLVVGLGLMLVTMATAPAIAWFYGRPELLKITFVIAFSRILGGISNQHMGILERHMRFGALAVTGVFSMAVGVATAIIAAMLGAGYWALVIMPMVSGMSHVISLWLITGWIPSLPKFGTGVRPMLDFGLKLTWSRIIYYFTDQIDYILVGRWCGAVMLGIYTKGFQLLTLPQSKIKGPVSNVAISGLSRLRDEPERYSRYYLRVIRGIVWLTAPLTGVMAAVATDMIVVLLGAKWAEAGPIFKIFAFAAFFRPVQSSVIWIFTSQGRVDRFSRWSIIVFVTTAISVVIGLPFGIRGVAVSHTLFYVVFIVPWSFIYAFDKTGITIRNLVASTGPAILVGLVMYSVGELTGYLAGDVQPILRMAFSISTCLVLFVLLCCIGPIRRDILEIVELKASFLKNDKKDDGEF